MEEQRAELRLELPDRGRVVRFLERRSRRATQGQQPSLERKQHPKHPVHFLFFCYSMMKDGVVHSLSLSAPIRERDIKVVHSS